VPGEAIDGLLIDLGSPPPDAADRFLLQPVTRSANAIAVILNDPRDLAAASPLVASAVPGNTGTLSVSALTVTDAGADPQQRAEIRFGALGGDGRRSYDWTSYDDVGNVVASGSGSGSWLAGEPLPAPPDGGINGFALELAGQPADGDRVVVEGTRYPASQNGNAQALAGLASGGLVGQTAGAALDFSEAFASAMADIGVRVQSARTAAGLSQAAAAGAQSRVAQASGVNLDEEAARLIQFQQSYQAAAKVLQVAQSVFDTLLEMARG
jgi:flagellar hook-associated protein 1 FlgK